MKTALITGANRGIGFEIAKQLGRRDFRILLGARDEQKGQVAAEKLRGLEIDTIPVKIDVADEQSIRTALEKMKSSSIRIDVLINNAGILLDQGIDILDVSMDTIRRTIDTNALGAFAVTRSFLPLMQSGSRVIMMSSGGGAICNGVGAWAPVYSLSKTMMNVITAQLARALKPQNIAVNAVCPGWVRTDMGGAGASRSIEKGAETPVWLATEAPSSLSGKFFRDKKQISF